MRKFKLCPLIIICCSIWAGYASAESKVNQISGKDSSISILESKIKSLDEKVELLDKKNRDIIESKIEGLEGTLEQIDKNISKAIDKSDEYSKNLYLLYTGSIALIIALLGFISWKNIKKWIQNTIESKTEEFLTDEYLRALIYKKAEPAIQMLVDEAKIKLNNLDNAREEYEKAKLELRETDINISKPITEELKKELELFVDKLTSAKLEETYAGEDWFYKGAEYFNNNDFMNAASAYEKAYNKNFHKEISLGNIAISYLRAPDNEKANVYFEKLKRLYPNYFNSNIDLILGNAIAISDNLGLKEGAKYFKQALTLNDKHVELLTIYGFYLFKEGRFIEALEYTEKALSIERDKFALFNKGHILLAQGKIAEAKQVYGEALNMVSDMQDLKKLALDDLDFLKSKGIHPAEIIDDIISWMKKEKT